VPGFLPISAVIPTGSRSRRLQKTLGSLAAQSVHPFEIIIVDASKSDRTKQVCTKGIAGLQARIGWLAAKVQGAAAQRNQGTALATQPFIMFFDDDVTFKPDCILRLWQAIHSDPQLGGVNALIVNQTYGRPGLISRTIFTLLHGRREKSFAGRVIGPAVNLLPEDRQDLPEIVPVDWLNTTCTIYRREALPNPPFPPQFTGYSLMEDLALSLQVGRNWKLANVRTARIFHDTQPADYKTDARGRSCMELANRHFVMTHIMGKASILNYLRLFLWELFSIASQVTTSAGRNSLIYILRGKADAVRQIVAGKGQERSAKRQEAEGTTTTRPPDDGTTRP
jgi:GT2 family glycosyltransferase